MPGDRPFSISSPRRPFSLRVSLIVPLGEIELSRVCDIPIVACASESVDTVVPTESTDGKLTFRCRRLIRPVRNHYPLAPRIKKPSQSETFSPTPSRTLSQSRALGIHRRAFLKNLQRHACQSYSLLLPTSQRWHHREMRRRRQPSSRGVRDVRHG